MDNLSQGRDRRQLEEQPDMQLLEIITPRRNEGKWWMSVPLVVFTKLNMALFEKSVDLSDLGQYRCRYALRMV